MVPPQQLLEGQLKDYFSTGSQTCRSEWETKSPVGNQPGSSGKVGAGGKREKSKGKTCTGKSANAVPHYHKLCSRVSHIWGNRRGQHIRSAMDKPRPGKTTFMIMDNNRNKHDAGMSTITGSCSRTQSRITSKTFGDAAWLRRIPARSPMTFEKVNYITPFL